jgi:hypothetical protein
MIKLYSFLFACSFAILAASQTPGSLDTSFDSDGIVEFGFGAGDDNVRDVKVLSDNKVLMLAYVNPASQGATLVKLNEDGSLDNSFGTNGVFQFESFSIGYRFTRSHYCCR